MAKQSRSEREFYKSAHSKRERQFVIIGPAPIGELLQRKSAAPIKPRAVQQPCDIGLFGDDADQLDLVSWLTEQTED